MRPVFSIIIISFLAILTGTRRAENKLPEPSGKYPAGVTYLSLTDSSRKELFDNNKNSYRDLTIKVWYPTGKKSASELYLEDPDRIISLFGFSNTYRTLRTNSSKGIKISADKEMYPVLIFSHGWGEHYSQNTILMEELASHGYIVFSIAHHYECKFSFYPDGRFITIDDNSNRLRNIINEQMNPAAMEIFNKMANVTDDYYREKIFEESCEIMPVLLKESPVYWAEDIKFMINELLNINKLNDLLKTKLDLDRIGVFGMSMGGIATNEVCLADKRVKAGINIDGGLYGSVLKKDIITPFLFINSQRYSGYGNLFNRKVANESFSVTILNSDHYNFSDYALYPVNNQSQIGTIDPRKPIELMNRLIVMFFDKYLLNKKVKNFQSILEEYEVEFVSKIS